MHRLPSGAERNENRQVKLSIATVAWGACLQTTPLPEIKGDFYTLFQSQKSKNHTPLSITYQDNLFIWHGDTCCVSSEGDLNNFFFPFNSCSCWIIIKCVMLLLFYIRKLQVTPQSKGCCSPWNALQVIFVLFTLATMFSMMWFTFILKTSLETMKKRVTSCTYRLLCCIIIINWCSK